MDEEGLGNANKRGLSYMLSSGVHACAQKSLVRNNEGISTDERQICNLQLINVQSWLRNVINRGVVGSICLYV